MSFVEGDGKPTSNPRLTPGLSKFFSLPSEVREKFVQDCIRRAQEDANYFNIHDITVNDLQEGFVLPSGNTVIRDEKGRNIVRAPVPEEFLFNRNNN